VDILLHIKDSNEHAFEQAFRQWHEKVYAYHFAKTRDESFAEECTQLTFIKLWESRHLLNADLPLEVQLFRIAKTTLIDQLRARLRDNRRLQVIRNLSGQSQEQPQYEPDCSRRIAFALDSLPPTRKKVFMLNRVHGLTYKQIGEELSISDRTVEKHISLALKQLKKILNLVF
jgi:RNA polymerase sigma-70 factor (ECF subfamily)